MSSDDSGIKSRICQTTDCNLKANLQCPTCVKLGIQDSYFCSQECFKKSWKTHKLIHKLIEEQTELKNNIYQPWSYVFTGKLRPFPEGPKRIVPTQIPHPPYALAENGVPYEEQKSKKSSQIKVLDDDEIESMRLVCKLGREVLDEAAEAIGVGVTTDEVDRVVHEACIVRECYPSPLGYYQFPRSCCTSVNEVICHGIPDLRPLQDGDICNVDVSVFHRGFHGDLNETFLIGNVNETGRKLTKVAWECLQEGIQTVQPGEKYREIGNVIQKHAQANGYSVVKSYCGHGIHRLFHTTPNVPHYAKNKAIGIMKPGHCFTIEPMISQGTWRDKCWPDKWTAVTADGLLSAQFEETLLVTDTGVEILTRRKAKNGQPYFMD